MLDNKQREIMTKLADEFEDLKKKYKPLLNPIEFSTMVLNSVFTELYISEPREGATEFLTTALQKNAKERVRELIRDF